jgi:hypothetical protein
MTDHKTILSHLHIMVSKGYLAIPSQHDKVITSLRTAYAEELNLKKDVTSYDDLIDALRLSLKGYNIS